MSNRIMRDSTTLTDIPTAGTDIVAAYVNGTYASTLVDVRRRFPKQPVAWIDVNGTHPDSAGILDVENGDATPFESAVWARARHVLHPGAYPPIIYCNRANLTPVFNDMANVGLKIGTGFRLWIATLDGTTHVADMTGVTAVQARGEAQTGGHYDESVVYDPAWLAPPVPPPPLPPPPGPVQYKADGTQSLAAWCADKGTDILTVLALMVMMHSDHKFGPLQGPYVLAGDYAALMPAGMTLWA